MSSPVDKVNLSLDDIIKLNKKSRGGGSRGRGAQGRGGVRGTGRGGVRGTGRGGVRGTGRGGRARGGRGTGGRGSFHVQGSKVSPLNRKFQRGGLNQGQQSGGLYTGLGARGQQARGARGQQARGARGQQARGVGGRGRGRGRGATGRGQSTIRGQTSFRGQTIKQRQQQSRQTVMDTHRNLPQLVTKTRGGRSRGRSQQYGQMRSDVLVQEQTIVTKRRRNWNQGKVRRPHTNNSGGGVTVSIINRDKASDVHLVMGGARGQGGTTRGGRGGRFGRGGRGALGNLTQGHFNQQSTRGTLRARGGSRGGKIKLRRQRLNNSMEMDMEDTLPRVQIHQEPVRQQQQPTVSPLQQQIKQLKPTKKQTFSFNKGDFAHAKTAVSLNERFSRRVGDDTQAQSTQDIGRQVYL